LEKQFPAVVSFRQACARGVRSYGRLGQIQSDHRADSKTNVPRRTGESIQPFAFRGGNCQFPLERTGSLSDLRLRRKVLIFLFTVRLQCHKTPFKTVMLEYPRLFLTPFSVAICGIALLLCSCATV